MLFFHLFSYFFSGGSVTFVTCNRWPLSKKHTNTDRIATAVPGPVNGLNLAAGECDG